MISVRHRVQPDLKAHPGQDRHLAEALLTTHFILSVLLCSIVCGGVPLNHESNTRHFLFLEVLACITRNMNAPPQSFQVVMATVMKMFVFWHVA